MNKKLNVYSQIYKKFDRTWYKQLSIILIGGGLVGLLSSFMLTLDKISVSENSTFIPDCTLNPVLSCVSVMQSSQSEILGFPNQLVGIIAFTVLISIGVLMWFTKGFNARLWQMLSAGTLLGLLLIHWLIFQSLFVIGALCLWCMLTWTIFAPIAWYSLLYSLKNKHIIPPKRYIKASKYIQEKHFQILASWYVLIIAGITLKFWYYWETLL